MNTIPNNNNVSNENETTNTSKIILANILATLNTNKAITTACFYPNGEITSDIRSNALNRMTEYKKSLAELANGLRVYALSYYNADIKATKNGRTFTNVSNSTVTHLISSVRECAKHLFITDLSDEKALYAAKVLCTFANTLKKDTDNSKVFTADFTSKGIKRAFEKALCEALNHDYATNITTRENYLAEKAIEKQVKECVKCAEKGRTKALENQLLKLKSLVTAERFNELEKNIRSKIVEVITPTSETGIDTSSATEYIETETEQKTA